jgi:hypothetical protein
MRWSPRGRTIFPTSSRELDSDQAATPAESSAQSFEGHSSQDILMVSCCYCSSQEWTHPKNPLHICIPTKVQIRTEFVKHNIILYRGYYIRLFLSGNVQPLAGSALQGTPETILWCTQKNGPKLGIPTFQSRLWSPL